MERTRQAAEAVLQELIPETMKTVGNDEALAILRGDLVSEIFDVAWSHRFEDDRRDAQRQIRQLVGDAIDKRRLEGKA